MGVITDLLHYDYDSVIVGGEHLKPKTKKAGIEGVRALFQHDEFGSPSPQLSISSNIVGLTTLCGVVMGGGLHGTEALARFMKTNQATAFDNPHAARRLAHDKTFIGCVRGAWIWGWRMAAFSTAMCFFTSAIPAYRGKHSPFDLTMGASLAGMVYKLKQGPKPMVVGGIMGGLLGTIFGCSYAGVLYVSGFTMDDIYNYQKRCTAREMEEERRRQQEERMKREKQAQKEMEANQGNAA